MPFLSFAWIRFYARLICQHDTTEEFFFHLMRYYKFIQSLSSMSETKNIFWRTLFWDYFWLWKEHKCGTYWWRRVSISCTEANERINGLFCWREISRVNCSTFGCISRELYEGCIIRKLNSNPHAHFYISEVNVVNVFALGLIFSLIKTL